MEGAACTLDAKAYRRLLMMADAWNHVSRQVPYEDLPMSLQDYLDEGGFRWSEEKERWIMPEMKNARWPESAEDEARGDFSD